VHCVLFHWRRIVIHAYPAMLSLGAVFGIVVGTLAAPSRGLDPRRVHAVMLLLLFPTLVGARLLFVVSHWTHYRGRLAAMWPRADGGAALYGGLLTSLPLSVPLVAVFGIPLGAFWDTAALAILIGMTFTKLGCLLNGCCAGRPSQSAVALYLPNVRRSGVPTSRHSLSRPPWRCSCLLGATAIWDRVPFEAVTAYGIARWGLEAEREIVDSVGARSLHRIISLMLVVLCLAACAVVWLTRGAFR